MNKHKRAKQPQVAFYNNPENRAIIYQIVALVLIFFVTYFVINNMFINIEKRGINTGFDFLSSEAGFGILQSLIEYDESDTHGKVFIVGLLNTILVSVIGIIFATIIGLLVGIGRLSKNFMVAKLSLIYVETFRNIPILLQILFWYNVVLASLPSPRQSISFFDSIFFNNRGLYIPRPILESGFTAVIIAFIIAIAGVFYLSKWANKRHDETGQEFPTFWVSLAILISAPLLVFLISGSPASLEIAALKGFNFKGGWTLIPELLALAFALSIYTATYIAEAVRAGIEAVPKGQKEAASALGLKDHVILKKVVLPQALRVIIPPVINQYLNLVKNSSLATAIGYPELVTIFSGTSLNQVGQAIEIILMTMAVYLTLSILISILMNYINSRMQIKER
ncbi:amino acid ABC transporter permease [Poseidonibacter ostreae]|jgi:general L-amino acid transport system permease protein|uniref:ABC transporter permease subunit n=1 Tax=Poseidonibacter ostreae TaxID=2654171 RepID=A0A6L4WYX6_9BACT|nr:amino acid ABC transporter permease [Poseidonibacter ostreae]KAB7888006.1 ABC transporter permease subunit [Poseidonibacter ostreae]KAB7891075.1 ABC transporter permease subunit [Poseidonibacter ostreae]KAB7892799.1 ABC transporter permease subunit [Poseidonibacter ostreae]